jgi:hypothetical protein
MFLVENIIRSACRRSEDTRLNILVISENNEKYMSLVCQTEHNFYLWATDNRSWDSNAEKKPENLQVINMDWPTTYFDMIICNDRLEQYDLGASLAHKFHLPILLIDHCSSEVVKPLHALAKVDIESPQAQLAKNPTVTVPVSEQISLSWPVAKLRLVIPPAIDTNKFCISDRRLSKDDFGTDLTERRVVFDNQIPPQVAESIFRTFGATTYSVIPTDSDIREKEKIYTQGDYFINSQNYVTVKMLESMACGNIPICFSTPDLVRFIENGVDGFIVEKSEDIAPLLLRLDKLSEEEISQISKNARKKIVNGSCITNEDFISKWKSVFSYMKSQYYGSAWNTGIPEV